jgi:hypothetical protein
MHDVGSTTDLLSARDTLSAGPGRFPIFMNFHVESWCHLFVSEIHKRGLHRERLRPEVHGKR